MTAGSRPAFHVTPPAGWINDPLGVTWHSSPEHPTAEGGRYELFVQHNPDAPEWVPGCRWAQLSSPDLVHWSWAGTALEPAAGEDGCWSGSVVVADDGTPVIVYTSVLAGALDTGRIALAHGDREWRRWAPDPGGPVLDGPPARLGMTHFRDPSVWRADGEWRMVVGGGFADGRAAAVQYGSPDLRIWRFDGVVAERPATEREPVASGSVWECVQLFPLEGSWVLLVSAWEHGSPQRVVCAVGDYDGRRFTARRWQPFTTTEAVYATTTFLDDAGRRCAISWIREPGPGGASWAGVLTVPVVLELRDDRLTLEPHPDVALLRGDLLAEGSGERVDLGPLPAQLEVAVAGEGRLVLTDDAGPLLDVAVQDGGLRLLLDGDIAEVFTGGDGGVRRIRPPVGGARVRGTGEPTLSVRVHGMLPAFWP